MLIVFTLLVVGGDVFPQDKDKDYLPVSLSNRSLILYSRGHFVKLHICFPPPECRSQFAGKMISVKRFHRYLKASDIA